MEWTPSERVAVPLVVMVVVPAVPVAVPMMVAPSAINVMEAPATVPETVN